MKIDKADLIDAPERRSVAFSDFEMRADGDTMSLEGYASVFDAPYDMYGGPEAGGWTEVVDRRAFDKTLAEKPDLHLLVNHEGMPLARTKSGTLAVSADKTGLKVKAPALDLANPLVQQLRSAMERGDMDEMSFAFRVKRQEWTEDEHERRLLEVSIHKGDVSVVNFGANPATSATLRSILARITEIDFDEALAEMRSLNDLPVDAHRILGRLIRESKPHEARTLSVTEAVAVING